MSAPVTDRPTRTWNDPDGPMIEPEAPSWIDEKVKAALRDLNPAARKIMEITGRRVSNRLAAERAANQVTIENYQNAAREFSRWTHIRPRSGAYIPRIPRDTTFALAAPRQPAQNARSAA